MNIKYVQKQRRARHRWDGRPPRASIYLRTSRHSAFAHPNGVEEPCAAMPKTQQNKVAQGIFDEKPIIWPVVIVMKRGQFQSITVDCNIFE
jgi:hypothetical protein